MLGAKPMKAGVNRPKPGKPNPPPPAPPIPGGGPPPPWKYSEK